MPTQGVFSNIAVPSGSINVLYRTVNGEDYIKAITVSDKDILDNDPATDIGISLEQLETIRLPLSSSGELTTLTVLSVTKKNGYHFLDVQDAVVDNISGFTTASIAITPFLQESFFYNDFNALLSNASEPEESSLRFDVDRTGGQAHPSNFNALAGIGTLTMGEMRYSPVGPESTPEPVISYSNGDYIASVTSSVKSFHVNRDLDLKVLEPEIINNLGIPQESVININPNFYNNPLFSFNATASLTIEIDDNPNFNNVTNNFISGAIAEQLYTNGVINAKYIPFNTFIESGSFSGGYAYVRLKQRNRVGFISDTSTTIEVTPFLSSNPQTPSYLNVSLFYLDQQPYAQPALVQDSNYTSTGFSNARYNGTKTGEADFSGISPAVAAKPLEVAIYRSDEDNGFICSQSLQDRTVSNILFEGPTEFPTVSTVAIGTVNTAVLTTSSTTINIKGVKNRIPQPGDIISIQAEQMQILTVTKLPSNDDTPFYNLFVKRGFGGTTATTHPQNYNIFRLSGARILSIDKSRLVAVSSKKVWIKDNRNIIKTNDRGFVIEVSEVCSV